MTRVRTDNVFGTLSSSLNDGLDTSMDSAGLANLAAVSSAEAIIILDPNRENGAPEIVVVTAHTGSATSATIVRGQFGTTARAHAIGTEWVHGPIASNATSYATAADDQGDFVPMDAWESWTPTLANLTLGSGTLVTKFVRIGRTINYRFVFTLGSGSAVGSNPTFTLPVAPASGFATASFPISYGKAVDANGGDFTLQDAFVSGSTMIIFYINGDGNTASLSSTAPFTWASGDSIVLSGTYEAAS